MGHRGGGPLQAFVRLGDTAVAAAEIVGASPLTIDDIVRDQDLQATLRSAIAVGPRPEHDDEAWASELTLDTPLRRTGKIIAIGRNYRAHADEEGAEAPESPLVFAKFPSSIVGPGQPIVWDPVNARQVDYEAELAVIVGRRARHVPLGQALDHVFGYTCLDDVSARDIQFGDGQWTRGKSLDTFCPIGPFIVTADEIPDPQTLRVRCEVNGRLVQDATTAQMIHSVAALISHCSAAFTLEPGDILATGTPAGVGAFRDPPLFLQDGDVVTVEIDGIGRLANTCVAVATT